MGGTPLLMDMTHGHWEVVRLLRCRYDSEGGHESYFDAPPPHVAIIICSLFFLSASDFP